MPLAVIRASAGSGKTYQLALSFIRILLRGELHGRPQNPSAILATTFTRAAAGEILDRVLRLLAEAALSEARRETLADNLGLALSREHCHRLLANLASHMDRLAISTMDAFFAQIAKAFAGELGLAPDWTMAVDEGEEKLLRETLHAILGEADLQSLAEALWTFRRGVVSSMLTALAELSHSLDRIVPADDTPAAFARPEIRRWSKEELTGAAKTFAGIAGWIPKTKSTKAPDSRWQSAIEKLAATLIAGEDATKLLTVPLAQKIFSSEGYYKQPAPAPLAATIKPLLSAACAALLRIHEGREAALLWLARHYQDHRRAAAFRAGAYTFGDVAAIVASAAPRCDDVYFRLGTRFEHVLFDEFQDTSRLQFGFFKPLIEEIGGTGGEVLVVGDEKQAIYGWRGGDRGLMHAPLDEIGKQIGCSPAKVLSESYRSSAAVLNAVNRTFQALRGGWLDEKQTDKEALEEAGREWTETFPEHRPARDVQKLRGRMRVILAGTGENADADAKNDALVTKALEITTAHLGEDPARKIGILLRKKNLMPRIIAGIRRAHPEVDVSGEGGNPLTDSRAVEVILCLLAWLDHPGSTAARYLVLKSPLAAVFGFPNSVSADAKPGDNEWRILRGLRREITLRGFATTLRSWIRHSTFTTVCSDHDQQRCEQLLEIAREFDARGPVRFSEFGARIRTRRVERPGGSQVRVMTIHASKGLEFEAVLLLELDAAQGGDTNVILTGCDGAPRIVPAKKDAPFLGMEDIVASQAAAGFMEELSVLYVGMTRACSFLDIILREGSKTPLGILLRRALQVDADRVVEECGGSSLRESDEARGRGKLAMDKPDPGIAGTATPSTKGLSTPVAVRITHTTPSGRGDGDVVNAEAILAPKTRSSMRRGDLIHSWLQQLTWIGDGLPDAATLVKSTADTTTDLACDGVTGWAHRLIEEAKAPESDLHRALARPPVQRTETLELWRERPFAVLREMNDRPELLSGKFDRVVLVRAPDGRALRANILDFKTDRFGSPDERAAIETRYAPQLAAYRDALAALCPQLNAASITASLVFVTA